MSNNFLTLLQKQQELRNILSRNLNEGAATRTHQLIANLYTNHPYSHNGFLIREARRRVNNYNLAQISNSNSNSNSNNNVARRLNFNNVNNMNLHGLYVNTNRVKLPVNRPIDPISLHKFKKGDAATRIRQNGKNYYFRTTSFNKWFGHNWKTMHPNSNANISNKTNPLSRKKVTRRNVSRVKFT
jgi:YHS domain-containing protein